MKVPDNLKKICDYLYDNGGKPYIVGGAVRDSLLGLEPKDFDVEVYCLPIADLIRHLSKFGEPKLVGESFAVVKLDEFDFSLPRRESKIGVKHTDFLVQADHTMSMHEASARRDFTINSMAETVNGVIIDTYGGLNDIKKKVLRPTGPAFKEDALRVLRGMQFAGRFEMTPDPLFIEYSKDLLPEYKHISKERIWEEWKKWALKSKKPSMGLEVLRQSEWLLAFYPELSNLIGIQQDPTHHPEGDAWIHTLHVVDEAALISVREKLGEDERLVLIFAALCHDLGKATTTKFHPVKQKWVAYGHEREIHLTESFLQRIGTPLSYIKRVIPLVREHMCHFALATVKNKDEYVGRLAIKMQPSNIVELDRLIEADVSGRPPLSKGKHPLMTDALSVASQIGALTGPVKKIITGDFLIKLGMVPGPNFSKIIEEAYTHQLAGHFKTQEEWEVKYHGKTK